MSKGGKIKEPSLVPMNSIHFEELDTEKLKGIKLKDIVMELHWTEWGYSLHEFLEKLNQQTKEGSK